MILPRNMLVAWTALTFLPPAAYMYAGNMSFTIPIAWIVLLTAISLCDVVIGYGMAMRFSATLPEEEHMTSEKENTLTIHCSNSGKSARVLIGISSPRSLGCKEDEKIITVPDSKRSTIDFTFTPLHRGSMEISTVHIGIRSPLGLWLVRKDFPGPTNIHVYPNLLPERRRLAMSFLQREAIGSHAVRQIGRGWEFEKLREYLPGDSFSEIHWKATARRGAPITKVFQIEQTQEIYVILDASRLSGRLMADSNEDMLTRQISSALLLAGIAEQQGDHIGLACFTDQVNTFIPAGSGRAHYKACRNSIYALEAKRVTPDFSEIFSFFHSRLRKRALLIFMMSIDDPILAENFSTHINLLSKNHLIIVNSILPEDTAPLFTKPIQTPGQINDMLAAHIRYNQIRNIEKKLAPTGIFFNISDNYSYSADIIAKYMELKQRQLL